MTLTSRLFAIAALSFALPSWSQPVKYESTTDGTTVEKAESKGISEKVIDRMPESTKKLLNKYQQGRVSSKYDGKSRYSSVLEMHDFNQDGVSDHDHSGNKMEGGMDELAAGKKGLVAKERKEALEKSRGNAGNCKDGQGPASQGNACFNLSGIIVDTGAAHGDAKSKHRVYKLTEEAKAAAEKAGEEYGKLAIEQARYGGKNKQVDMDLLRSEAAWLEQQKRHMTEAAWKTLRAARLAGIDTSVTPDDPFMTKVGNMLSNGDGDDKIAQEVVLKDRTDSQGMCNVGGAWGVCTEQTQAKANESISKETEAIRESIKRDEAAYAAAQQKIREKYSLSMKELTKKEVSEGRATYELEEQVREQVLAGVAKSGAENQKSLEEETAKAQACMGKDKWCYGGVGVANVNSDPKMVAAQAQPGAKPIDKFDEVQGDAGIAFNDTREIIYNRLSEAQLAPVNKIESVMKGMDFDRDKYPEFYEQLDDLKKDAKNLEDSNGSDYDADSQNVPMMFGIRLGENDTYRPNADKSSGPAPASTNTSSAPAATMGGAGAPTGAAVTGPATPMF
jgi:hypothetical protein